MQRKADGFKHWFESIDSKVCEEVLILGVFIFVLVVFLLSQLNGIYTLRDMYILLGASGCFLVIPFVCIFHIRRLDEDA